MKTITCAVLLALAAAPLMAQSLEVGSEPANFVCRNWLNPGTFDNFDELKGDVVVITSWGISSSSSMDRVREVAKLQDSPGLHIITFYEQSHQLDAIQKALNEMKAKFPVAFDGFREAGYEVEALPHTWVVGIDGKIIFSGTGAVTDVIKKELAKVKYPGLGRHSVHKLLEPAAKAFAEGKMAEAYKLAEKLYDETDDEEVEDDADYIMDRIDGRIGTLLVRAESSETVKEFRVAKACWSELATRFKGMEDAAEAKERLEKLNGARSVQSEITARLELLRLVLSLDVAFEDVPQEAGPLTEFRKKCIAAYEKFAADNKETGAAEIAAEFAALLKELVPAAEDKEE